MLYVTLERTVRRPPAVVWEHLTDLSAATTWVDELVEVRTTNDRPIGAGTRLIVQRGAPGRLQKVTSEVTAFRAGSLLALETRLRTVLLLDRVTLEPIAAGTKLGVFAELHHGNAKTGMLSRAPGLAPATAEEAAIRSIYERSIDALVTRIERQSAIPYR